MQTSTHSIETANLSAMVPEVLDSMFGEQAFRFDLKEGTVTSFSGTRTVYLSADLIRGMHQALEHETGEAWKIVLKNCGYIWGKRVSQALNKELRLLAQQNMEDIPADDFLLMLERYFSGNGWGLMRFDLAEAESHGIVQATLTDSLFVAALAQQDGLVDVMIAGMLKGMFEAVSGQPLECIQVTCQRGESNESKFLLSAPERISVVEASTAQNPGVGFDGALDKLRAA